MFSFGAHFTDERSWHLHFEEQRDKKGVVCHRCQCTDHYRLRNKWSYRCKSCKARISLRSVTIMESSKLSFMTWHRTMFLLSATKKGFSSKEIQRQLGAKRYGPGRWSISFARRWDKGTTAIPWRERWRRTRGISPSRRRPGTTRHRKRAAAARPRSM